MARILPQRLTNLVLKTKLLWAVVAVNLFGTLFGFYYYLPQISETSWPLWIFVVDSPLSTLAIATSLILYAEGWQSKLLDAFAFISNMKYGLWTVSVLLFYFNSFWSANSTPMYIFLLVSHFLMFIQAFLILEFTDFSLKALLSVFIWFLANDTLDYFLDIHPRLFTDHSHPVSAAMIFAYLLTFISVGIYLLHRNSADKLSLFNIFVDK